jgi:copper chaperone CopZ
VVDAAAARVAAFRVRGMCCAACPARIAAALRSLPGVAACAIDEASGRVSVSYDGGAPGTNGSALGPRALRDALVALGYTAEPWDADGNGTGDDAAADTAAEAAEWCADVA